MSNLGEILSRFNPNRNNQLSAYKDSLKKAGLTPEEVRAAVKSHPANTYPLEGLGDLASMRVSGGAEHLAYEAVSVGVDPTNYLITAAERARESGRSKVGPFGDSAQPLAQLKTRIEGQKTRRVVGETIFVGT